ncbi:hypothetical protein AYI68_g5686 [Smittium mucronatum]|uniref:Uncharacterized protein n=1 Tax=Smittium mucronatum TaxID=133383 RepID=A0A1R0GTJ4_9FUNG|nr:hypothetical protein AYI68_g5686 [Smittium mucronatum]
MTHINDFLTKDGLNMEIPTIQSYVAPRIFSKVMKAAIEPLRSMGIKMIFFIDETAIVDYWKKNFIASKRWYWIT